MNFANTVAIIIAGPFLVGVTDGAVGPDNMVVALPFISIDLSSDQGEGVDVVFQGFTVGVMDNSQANLARFSAYCPDNRGAVVIIGAVTNLFIGSAARWISRVRMILTFFPPRSETFHPFQFGYHLKGAAVGVVGHWLEFRGAHPARFGD